MSASARAAATRPATARPQAAVIRAQKARSGGGVRIGFEGGQMPLARRIPKRGFNNIFAEPLTAVNVAVLNKFEDGAVVDAAALIEKGILHDCKYGLKGSWQRQRFQEGHREGCRLLGVCQGKNRKGGRKGRGGVSVYNTP